MLSLIAIVLGGGLVAQALMFQSTINSLNDKLTVVDGRVDTVQAAKTHNFTIRLGEGLIVNQTDEQLASLEYHRWNPGVLVVNKGDTVRLTIINEDHHVHSFELDAFGVDSGKLMPEGMPGDRTTVTFVANQAGVFEFECGVDPFMPPPPAPEECSEDHPTMTGYLVVLAI